jgi:hypothetical protein
MNLTESYKRRLQELAGVKNYNEFRLSALVKTAQKFDNYNDFEYSYSIEINHGYFWHITTDKDFKTSSETGPRDMSSMSSGEALNKGALMVTSDLSYWDFHYNNYDEYDDDEIEAIKRPYAALLDLSDINPQKIKQVSRGFGNEVYIWPDDVKKIKIIGVYTIQKARQLNKTFHDIIPQSEKELEKLWIYAKSKK